MANRFSSGEDFLRWNEEMARRYDPESYHLRSNVFIRWIERRRVRVILRFLKAGREDAVLEVGCGAGNVLEQVQSGRLFGIDLSAFLIRKSQNRLSPRRARLTQSDAERLPFADRGFSRLICTEVLEHVIDPCAVIREMARVTTKDATIVISVPNETCIDAIKGFTRSLGLGRWLLHGGDGDYISPDKMTDEWHLHRFDLPLLREISEDVLIIRQVKAIPFRFVPLRYVVLCQRDDSA